MDGICTVEQSVPDNLTTVIGYDLERSYFISLMHIMKLVSKLLIELTIILIKKLTIVFTSIIIKL